jgi:hypothetical protein
MIVSSGETDPATKEEEKMARQHFNVEVEVGGRVYRVSDSATAKDVNPQAAAQRRAFTRLADTFPEVKEAITTGRETIHVLKVEETSSPWQTLRLPTEQEKADRHRVMLVWGFVRVARDRDPLDDLDRYAAKSGKANTGYARAAEAIAWVGMQVMKDDVKRAFAVSILDDLQMAGALQRPWREADEEANPIEDDIVADASMFDAIIDRYKEVALEKALRWSGRSTGPIHNILDDIRREVAADLYRHLTEGGTWF